MRSYLQYDTKSGIVGTVSWRLVVEHRQQSASILGQPLHELLDLRALDVGAAIARLSVVI